MIHHVMMFPSVNPSASSAGLHALEIIGGGPQRSTCGASSGGSGGALSGRGLRPRIPARGGRAVAGRLRACVSGPAGGRYSAIISLLTKPLLYFHPSVGRSTVYQICRNGPEGAGGGETREARRVRRGHCARGSAPPDSLEGDAAPRALSCGCFAASSSSSFRQRMSASDWLANSSRSSVLSDGSRRTAEMTCGPRAWDRSRSSAFHRKEMRGALAASAGGGWCLGPRLKHGGDPGAAGDHPDALRAAELHPAALRGELLHREGAPALVGVAPLRTAEGELRKRRRRGGAEHGGGVSQPPHGAAAAPPGASGVAARARRLPDLQRVHVLRHLPAVRELRVDPLVVDLDHKVDKPDVVVGAAAGRGRAEAAGLEERPRRTGCRTKVRRGGGRETAPDRSVLALDDLAVLLEGQLDVLPDRQAQDVLLRLRRGPTEWRSHEHDVQNPEGTLSCLQTPLAVGWLLPILDIWLYGALLTLQPIFAALSNVHDIIFDLSAHARNVCTPARGTAARTSPSEITRGPCTVGSVANGQPRENIGYGGSTVRERTAAPAGQI